MCIGEPVGGNRNEGRVMMGLEQGGLAEAEGGGLQRTLTHRTVVPHGDDMAQSSDAR